MITHGQLVTTPGPFRQLTVRAVIHNHLAPLLVGQSVTIGPLIGRDGTKRHSRHLQARVKESTPRGWLIATSAVDAEQIKVTRIA